MKTLLDYLQENHIPVHAICNGQGKCRKCKIKGYGLKANEKDKQYLSQEEIAQGYRLACFHSYDENVKIELTQEQGEILTSFDTKITQTKHSQGKGIIVDIGTTTLVFQLIDRVNGNILDTQSTYNPQIAYGGDVITRIHYDTNHPHRLTSCIRKTIKDHIIKWLNEDIVEMIVVGNTTMIHIFLDINTRSLGQVPFTVIQKDLFMTNSKDIFHIDQHFKVITLPHISAYIGSDIVSGMYALDLFKKENHYIFLDLGTNGEIVAGNHEKMYATSSAAGPAFEGGGIECGGASIEGAIYKVKEEKGCLKVLTIHDEKPICICGTGLISLIAYLRKKDYINELGRFQNGHDRYEVCSNIYITNQDIQNFLLAKAAIQTVLAIMLKKLNNVEKIFISGGFGNKLNLDDLVTLKILPEEVKDKVVIMKNTALEGAYKMLLKHDFQSLEDMISKVETIELSTYEDFEDLLIEGLYI